MKRWIAGFVVVAACGGSSSGGGDVDAGAPDGRRVADAGDVDASGPDAPPPPPDALAPEATFAADLDLSVAPVVVGRTCAAAPSYAVNTLRTNGADLTEAPVDDCLAAGDEVLLLNVQGSAADTTNVGVYELFQVASVDGTLVTFTSDVTRTYGRDGKVALYRVPRFGAATVAAGATVTSKAWDGASGGVVVLRADALTVDGTLTAAGLGYRSGRWSQDDGDCDDNLTTETGESITGPALAQITANGGAAGGIQAIDNISYNGDDPLSPSAGHATAGQAGDNARGRTLGAPGAAYGSGDGTTLTMGSGSSGNLTCEAGAVINLRPVAPAAGGIVLLLGGDVTVGATGTITATAPPASRSTAASGGTVLIRANDVTLGTNQVTARGAVAASVGAFTNTASAGYVIIDATGTVTGESDPVSSRP